ncbi:SH3 domain-containing protein [Acinetobacter silvestris]|uniref:SH3 domain-containing protein n=1 Tax=Acinetobacter silvestris TaxID=1977882 RepID=UPI003306EDE6
MHLRSAPDLASESKLIIPQGNFLKVYEENHNGWVKISINLNGLGADGYVCKDYIKPL